QSYDSRFWGQVPILNIKGKAFIIYFSWDSEKHWIRFKRLGHLID
ncbi:MAG TPA: S26 family signal peptidase, partial [Deltaproteobacteria bacterium]|nr:S26 family signal peptidase [Deltaproteobacteria bacterium]